MSQQRRRPPSKRPASPRGVQSVHLVHDDQESLGSIISDKIGPKIKSAAAWVTTLVVLGGAIVGIWTYFNLPWWVSNHELNTTVGNVKTELGQVIDQKTGEVKNLSVANTREVQTTVTNVQKTVEDLARKNEQSTAAFLEGQTRFLFAQKNNMAATLGSIDAQLSTKPGDTFLLQRKAETQNAIDYLSREQEATQQSLRRLRGQQ